MLSAYALHAGRLAPLPADRDLADAVWLDLMQPDADEVAMLAGLGIEVPSLDEMEEIEISNRIYREGDTDYLTVVLPGQDAGRTQISAPVTFIVTPRRLITVRHHVPRPFTTFPDRADRSSAGCGSHLRVYLGLVEEIVARLADLLEATGRALDQTAAQVYGDGGARDPDLLQAALHAIGREGEALGRVRLALLSMERMLSTFGLWARDRDEPGLKPLVAGQISDIRALEVHADFLSSRISLTNDTTLGMINLAQNATVRIVSVVAALFLPPTLIASIYGMNFRVMPELAEGWGYPAALAAMVASALVTYLYFKWRRWL